MGPRREDQRARRHHLDARLGSADEHVVAVDARRRRLQPERDPATPATASPKAPSSGRPRRARRLRQRPQAPSPVEVVLDDLDPATAPRQLQRRGHARRPRRRRRARPPRAATPRRGAAVSLRQSPRPATRRANACMTRCTPGTPARSSWWFMPSGKNQSAIAQQVRVPRADDVLRLDAHPLGGRDAAGHHVGLVVDPGEAPVARRPQARRARAAGGTWGSARAPGDRRRPARPPPARPARRRRLAVEVQRHRIARRAEAGHGPRD